MPYRDRATYLNYQRKYAFLRKNSKAQYDIDYYQSHGATLKKRTRIRKHAGRQNLAAYKLDQGCAICGYKGHPDALHFDHLPGSDKKYNVGDMATRNWSEVLAEIEKCQVLCANCHAIETAARRREKQEAKKDKDSECRQLKIRFA